MVAGVKESSAPGNVIRWGQNSYYGESSLTMGSLKSVLLLTESWLFTEPPTFQSIKSPTFQSNPMSHTPRSSLSSLLIAVPETFDPRTQRTPPRRHRSLRVERGGQAGCRGRESPRKKTLATFSAVALANGCWNSELFG